MIDFFMSFFIPDKIRHIFHIENDRRATILEWDILYSMFVLFGFSILAILIIVGAIRFVAEKELRKEIRKKETRFRCKKENT